MQIKIKLVNVYIAKYDFIQVKSLYEGITYYHDINVRGKTLRVAFLNDFESFYSRLKQNILEVQLLLILHLR